MAKVKINFELNQEFTAKALAERISDFDSGPDNKFKYDLIMALLDHVDCAATIDIAKRVAKHADGVFLTAEEHAALKAPAKGVKKSPRDAAAEA